MTDGIQVLTLHGLEIGHYPSCGTARRAQRETLPTALRPYYAGVGPDGRPLFRAEALPNELADRYKLASV